MDEEFEALLRSRNRWELGAIVAYLTFVAWSAAANVILWTMDHPLGVRGFALAFSALAISGVFVFANAQAKRARLRVHTHVFVWTTPEKGKAKR